jgi:hypothetical protein
MTKHVYAVGGAWMDSDTPTYDDMPDSWKFTHPVTGERLIICDQTDHYDEKFDSQFGEWVEVADGLWVSKVHGLDHIERKWWETMSRVVDQYDGAPREVTFIVRCPPDDADYVEHIRSDIGDGKGEMIKDLPAPEWAGEVD